VAAVKAGASDYLRKEACDVIHLNNLISSERSLSARDPRIVAVIDMIAHRPGVTPQALAETVNLSVSRVRHLFCEQTGLPLGAYQDESRLQRAALLLRVSFMTVSEIAHEVGWSDERAFRDGFRDRFACTPKEYRAANCTH
jgi:AraC family transcriptional regulator of arabinose operon